ncbi:hypothetical protein LKK83_12975 [Phormidium sp. CCY1219]|nr:hypothetical protein [Phormidium sp. CCY1219]
MHLRGGIFRNRSEAIARVPEYGSIQIGFSSPAADSRGVGRGTPPEFCLLLKSDKATGLIDL